MSNEQIVSIFVRGLDKLFADTYDMTTKILHITLFCGEHFLLLRRESFIILKSKYPETFFKIKLIMYENLQYSQITNKLNISLNRTTIIKIKHRLILKNVCFTLLPLSYYSYYFKEMK